MSTATNTLIAHRYEIEEKLGEGGMGIVYRVRDRLSNQPMALKQVKLRAAALQFGSKGDSAEFTLALAREFQTLASLRHPYIISVLDYGFDAEQQPYFTMSLLEGAQTIREAASGLDLQDKISLILQMLQALAYLHQRGILHRDLKPGNVLVDVNGTVKVLDFGLAVEPEQAIGTVGTLAYMAPEVIEKESASQASDLYAVGLIAYELLTGEYPFNTSNLGALMQDILSKPIDFSRLPATSSPTPPQFVIIPDDMPTTSAIREEVAAESDSTQGGSLPVPLSDSSQLDMTVIGVELPRPISSNSLPPLPILSTQLTLREVIRKLLERNSEHRYQTAEAVIRDLCAAVERPLPPESQVIRESFLQAAKFIGREAPLHQLLQGLEQVLHGQGSAYLIGGESGVGKSRLLDELRTRALIRGARVLRGQAITEGGLPYQVWREPMRSLVISTPLSDFEAGVLRDLVPDISSLLERPIPDVPALEGTARQQRILQTMLDLFKRQTQPLVLLLEDLQWENLAALQFLLRSLPPILIVGTYRQDEAPDLPADLPNVAVIHLARLNETEIGALSLSMLGTAPPNLVNLLHRETEGNVFFLVEVVRVLAEEAGRLSEIGHMALPEQVFAGGVWAILERRLSRIPAEYQTPLDIAAAIGRQLDLDLLQAIAPEIAWESWLLTCSNAAVLEIQDNRWRFAHDKLREHLLGGIPAEQRPLIHQQIAIGMEQVYADDPARYSALAYHWGMAKDEAWEAHYAELAGEQAYNISDMTAALRYYERAIALKDQIETRQLALLYIRFGDSLTRLGRYAEALKYLQLSRTLARQIKDESIEAQSLLYQGINRAKQGENTLAIYEKVVEISRRIEDQRTLADTLAWLAAAHAIHTRDYQAARQCAEEAVAISRTLDVPIVLIRAVSAAAIAADCNREDAQAEQYFAEALTLAQAIGDRLEISIIQGNRANFLSNRGAFEDAYRLTQENVALIRSIGEKQTLTINLSNLISLACQLNKLEEAEAHLLEAAQLVLDTPHYQAGVLMNKVEILRQREAWEEGAMLAACLREALPADAPEMGEIDQMLRDFQRQLPYVTYAAACKRGKQLSLDEAIEMICDGEV